MYREIEGSGFEFMMGGNSFKSKDHNIIFARIDTDVTTNLHGQHSGIYVHNKRNNKRYLIAEDYSSSAVDIDIEIVSEDGLPLSEATIESIHRNLFFANQSSFGTLFLYDCEGNKRKVKAGDENYYDIFLTARFSNPYAIETDYGIVGYRVTLETDTNMYWVGVINKTYTGSTSVSASINNLSDTTELLYPKLTITTQETTGDLSVYNSSEEGEKFVIKAVPPSSRIVIDGSANYISGDYHEKVSDWNFPKIYSGENTIIFDGASKVEVEYFEKRSLR